MELVFAITAVSFIFFWISALIRFFVLMLSAKGWEAFSYRPVLNLFWLGAATLSFLAALFFPVSICRPPRRSSLDNQARADLKNLENACKAYTLEYEHPPTGNRTQLLQILRGDNARRIVFFETPSRRGAISKQGEFIDPWGTAYRLTIISNQRPVLASAGPNRTFGDSDDLSTTN